MDSGDRRKLGSLLSIGAIVWGWISAVGGKERIYICSGVSTECLVSVSTRESQMGVVLAWLGIGGLALTLLVARSSLGRWRWFWAVLIPVVVVPIGLVHAARSEVTREDIVAERRAERQERERVTALLEDALGVGTPSHPTAPPGAYEFDYGWASVSTSAPAGQRCVLADECWTITVELTHACTGRLNVGGAFVLDGRHVDGFSSQPLNQEGSGASRFSRQLPLGLRDMPDGVEARISSVRCLSWAGGYTPNATSESRS